MSDLAAGATRLPPGPSQPAFVQTLRFIREPLALLDESARAYGDVFTLRLLGLGDWVMLSSPKDIRTMFSGAPEVLHAGEANRAIFGALTGATSSLVLDDRAHQRRRRLLIPPFSGERMTAYTEAMRDATAEAVRSWQPGTTIPLARALRSIALQIVMRAIFGLDRGPGAARLTELLTRLSVFGVGSPLLLFPALQRDLGRFSPWGRILHLARQTDVELYAEIRRRRARPVEGGEDMLSLLLAVRDEEGRALEEVELRDELITMLFAGHETTAMAMAWTFERLLSEPEILAKTQEELDRVLEGKPVERAHLPRLEYLEAVIREGMRARPIGPVGGTRKLTAPFEVGGYLLPVGTTIGNCVHLVHGRPESYPEPERFKPERFLETKPEPNAWTPFGGGPRRCPGASFAIHEMKIVLATVLTGARLSLVRPNARPVRHGFFLSPEDDLPTRVLPRPRPEGAAGMSS